MTIDPFHPDGIYQCDGCDRIYAEYHNGCPHDHDPPRKVRLVVVDDSAIIDGENHG